MPWLPPALLGLGAASVALYATLLITGALGWWPWTAPVATDLLIDEVPWIAAAVLVLVTGSWVWRRLPDNPSAAWFVVMQGAVATTGVSDTLLSALLSVDAGRGVLAGLMFTSQSLVALATIAMAHVLITFADGVVERPYEAWLLRASWLSMAVPVIVALAVPTVVFPWYRALDPVANPAHVGVLSMDRATADALIGLAQGVFIIPGLVVLVARYRRASLPGRRRFRWLLVPVVLGTTVITIQLVAPTPALVNVLAIGAQAIVAITLALGLLSPRRFDADDVLRRSIVYGALWVSIALAYVAAGSVLGIAAGHRLPMQWAVVVTVIATLGFQPARRWLDRLADRLVFGPRSDPARVIADLGATLADTYDLDTLLAQMAATVRQGLGLQWARVVLDQEWREQVGIHATTPGIDSGADEEPSNGAALVVPIVLDGEELGVVACGPRTGGPLTSDDRAIVETLARQAGLAVRNVRLTVQLSHQASELVASRRRLVRAQDAERRRIERNIHDGIQQDLVALIGLAGHVQHLDDGSDVVGPELAGLRVGLQRVLRDLRELAAGIHPTLLTDRGLLSAVEALAARHPVTVGVRADPSLRDLRMPAEIEGAAYFTIAEALANSLKHADADQVIVVLTRSNGTLSVRVRDNGVGVGDLATATNGTGLLNLSERWAALEGHLTVDSTPGEGTTVLASVPLTPTPAATAPDSPP